VPQQHVDDLARTSIAKELTQFLLVIGDPMLFYERDKVRGSVTSERGLAEVRVGRDEVFRARMNVGEVTTATAGDFNLLASSVGTFQQQDFAPALARFNRTKKTGSSCADDDDIPFQHKELRARDRKPAKIRRESPQGDRSRPNEPTEDSIMCELS
jgi:hypothetical protein